MTIHESESFDTEQSAQDRAEYLKRAYYGYDPTVRVYQDTGGLWAVTMTRANSCD